MMKIAILLGCLGAQTLMTFGQAATRKLPANINHPAINNYAPFISLDGNSMVYISDLGEDHELVLTYTTRQGVNWKDPSVLPRTIGHKLNFLKGFGLSPDGRTLYLANMKSNGMGGFDLYSSKLKGLVWEEPLNMLLPVNSRENEACPSISLDGTSFYYMRCQKMDLTSASGCRILVMKKKANGQWDSPVELPNYINTGNSQSPRIMGDSEMLVFSSDRLQPNKGGMDLYYTRFTDGVWSRPLPLDFANTAGDDVFVSSTSAGMYLLKDAPGQRSNELVEYLFPSEVRPKGTLRLEGTVSGVPDPASIFVTVYRLEDQHKLSMTQPATDGSFLLYLNYGSLYQLVVEPADEHYTFHSKVIDLRRDGNPMIERMAFTMEKVAPGTLLDLTAIEFETSSASLKAGSELELSRLTRLIQGNAERSFGIEVTLYGFEQDTVRSNADLTEVAYDTTRIPVTYQLDSVTTATRDSLVIHTRFHNDRTLRQAQAITEALIRQGISHGRLASSGKAVVEAIPEKRRTVIQVIAH